MMKKLVKPGVFIAVILGIVIFQSCNKEDLEQQTMVETKTQALDYVNLMESFSLTTVEEVTSGDDGLKSATIADCLKVTVHDNENGEFWPRSWTLDWGTENCECFSGNVKRGRIHVTLSDWWKNEGSLREITFKDFYLNDAKMEGVKTILNTGFNDSGNLTFKKTVADAKLTYPDESSMLWNCEKTSEQIAGAETLVFADDVWLVTGGGSGINLDGKSYTIEITTALEYRNGCFYPVSGIVEVATEGEEVKTINYGDGECDNLVAITIGDVTETVEL